MDTKKDTKSASEDHIEVHGTEDGKLYIETSDLFALRSVQELIKRVVKSDALKDVNKLTSTEIGQSAF